MEVNYLHSLIILYISFIILCYLQEVVQILKSIRPPVMTELNYRAKHIISSNKSSLSYSEFMYLAFTHLEICCKETIISLWWNLEMPRLCCKIYTVKCPVNKEVRSNLFILQPQHIFLSLSFHGWSSICNFSCSRHLQGQCLEVGRRFWKTPNLYTFTLQMATAMFAETLDNYQHLTCPIPRNRSYTCNIYYHVELYIIPPRTLLKNHLQSKDYSCNRHLFTPAKWKDVL
jgi:hypothetical protein